MRKTLALLVCGALLMFGVAAVSAPAEARREGLRAGGHKVGHARAARAANGNMRRRHVINRHIGRMHRRHANHRGRVVWRSAASCSYEYGRWQATGSLYWRERYDACAN